MLFIIVDEISCNLDSREPGLHSHMKLKMLPSIRVFPSILLLGTMLAINAQWAQPIQAQPSRKFQCELVAGIPTTVVKTVRGNIPTIHWVKSFTGRYNPHSASQRDHFLIKVERNLSQQAKR
jgi:hypothetical protein